MAPFEESEAHQLADGKVEEGEHESRTYSQNQREVSEKKLTYLILNFLLVKYVVPVNIL